MSCLDLGGGWQRQREASQQHLGAELGPWSAQASSGPRRAPQAPPVTLVTAVSVFAPQCCCLLREPHGTASESTWPAST